MRTGCRICDEGTGGIYCCPQHSPYTLKAVESKPTSIETHSCQRCGKIFMIGFACTDCQLEEYYHKYPEMKKYSK